MQSSAPILPGPPFPKQRILRRKVAKELIEPAAAGYNSTLGEFILKYDDVRALASPDEALLNFLQSSYRAAANLANWDRKALERQ